MTDRPKLVVGIDIGGTNIKVGFVDEEGVILERRVLKTADHSDPRGLVSALASLIEDSARDFRLVGIGVGAPNGNFFRGSIDQPPNLPWEGNTPLASWMAEAVGVPCLLTNDANAAALGELLFGAAKGMRDFLFITLGTGLGSGIVAGGQLVYGHGGAAGELGHIIVEPGGRPCGCGRRGCLEQYASAPGLVTTYRALRADSLAETSSQTIAERAEAGDETALEAFELTARVLGLALANSVAYTQPECIFLFGGLVQAGDSLLAPVRRHFEANLLNVYRGQTRIEISGLPENDAAILGAASLIWNSQNSQ